MKRGRGPEPQGEGAGGAGHGIEDGRGQGTCSSVRGQEGCLDELMPVLMAMGTKAIQAGPSATARW
jgi:hypothetical protein